MTRMLPSVNSMLMGILRPALPAATVGTLIPANMPYPFVLARGVGGAAIDPRFVGSSLVDVQVWSQSDTVSEDLSEDARVALVIAWRNQTVVLGVGSIARFSEESSPLLLPSDAAPKGVYRYQATYRLATRPA